MSKQIKILGTEIAVEKDVEHQIHNYFQELETEYESEIVADLKNSILEKLLAVSKSRAVNTQDIEQIKNEVGHISRPIYKAFFRYAGVFGGVANGIGKYFQIPVFIPRLVFSIPLIVLVLSMLEFIGYYVFIMDIPLIFLKEVNDSFTLSNLSENIINRSDWLVIIYLLIWVFVPRAKTKENVEKLDGKDIQNEELKLAIINKVSYKSGFLRNLVTNILFITAKVGMFLFDVLVSVLNNLFTSLFFKFVGAVVGVLIIFGFIISLASSIIFSLGYRVNNVTGEESLSSSSVSSSQ